MVELEIIVDKYTLVLAEKPYGSGASNRRWRFTLDKYEYKVRVDEIKELIAKGEYSQAVEIADTIDWRRVKSVMMLCTISDLYKINRRYEDAKNMLLLAYERRPGGKTICYSLCELCIKTEEFVQAYNYYKEFMQIAPKDSGRYILQYRLYEAQEVSLEERIGVLEELKKRDYREKWAYELAYLYHRVGLATRCVEECDELILWFGEGRYVIKAMELKMLHVPLSEAQQEKYDKRFDIPQTDEAEEDRVNADGLVPGAEKTAADEAWSDTGELFNDSDKVGQMTGQDAGEQQSLAAGEQSGNRMTGEEGALQAPAGGVPVAEQPTEELDIHVKTMDMSRYNTINLQAELAAGLREVLSDNRTQTDAITRSIVAPMLDSEEEKSEVFFGETEELSGQYPGGGAVPEGMEEIVPGVNWAADRLKPEEAETAESEAALQEESETDKAEPEVTLSGKPEADETKSEITLPGKPETDEVKPEAALREEPETDETESEKALQEEPKTEEPEPMTDKTAQIVMQEMRRERTGSGEEQVLTAQPPEELAKVLSQESDGQLRLVMPEGESVEKQITGQMSIQDILNEWERMKKENEEKRKEEVRQHVLQQTGNMFTEFEASVRDGLLEQIESGKIDLDTLQQDAESAEIPEEGQASVTDEAEPTEEFPALQELEESEESELSAESDAVDTKKAEDEESNEKVQESDAQLQEESEESESSAESDAADMEEAEDEEPDQASDMDDYGETEEIEEIEEPEETEESEEAEESEETEESEEDGPEKSNEEGLPEEEMSDEEGQPEKEAPALQEREQTKTRALTKEEKEIFAPFIHSRSGQEKLAKAIDSISLAAYTGNIIITGEEGMDTLTLAQKMIRELQMSDSNFSGKVAKISGKGMNGKDVGKTLGQVKSGALIIRKASGMAEATVDALHKALQQEDFGIVIVLEDTKKNMDKLLANHPKLGESFTARMHVEAMGNDALVAYGRQYAKEQEYTIDDLGVLALHTRIEERQTSDHAVTPSEVKEIVDEAIYHANRKTPKHFIDILIAKRYDEEDMIILTEKDFV